MRKHSLLLSLLVMLFAVFITACENSSSKGASISGPDQGIILKPVLNVSAVQLEGARYKFTGTLTGGNASDYTFNWFFGDGTDNVTGTDLEIEHSFAKEGAFNVVLSAEPNDPSITKPVDGVVTVSYSTSGILVSDVLISTVSSPLDYTFQILATSSDGSDLTYSWDFGDGATLANGDSIATHTYARYNQTYSLTAVVTSANGNSINVGPVLVKTSDLKAVVSVINNPVNAKNKTFSVNFYDENDNLIHGSSVAGEVENLENVFYNWNFGDNEYDNGTSREVSHTYTNGASSKYTVTLTATSDNYEGEIVGTAEANVELAYSLTSFTAALTGDYGLTLEASVQGNGGIAYADKEVTYRFTFPDGSTTSQSVIHDAEGNTTTPVQVSTDLSRYYPNYNVTVEVLDGGVTIADGSISAARPVFEYELIISEGSSYKNKTFTVAPKEGSFLLKDAAYSWNFGDNVIEEGSTASVSHTYTSIGTFNISVTISSPLISETGLTVKDATGSLTITSTITVNNYNCSTNGAEFDFLQYTCTVDAVSTGDSLTYKWYVDGVLQNNQTGKSFTKKHEKYNKVYKVEVEVGVQGISGVQPVRKAFSLGTPAVYATITGPDNLVHGEIGTYTVAAKVTHNGTTKEVTLQNPTYTFKIAENSVSENNGSNKTWSREYLPTEEQYGNGNRVTRTVSAVISSTSINGGSITSSSKTTTITKLDAALEHFQSANISCSPKNGISFIRQQCKVTLSVKNNLSGLVGNFSDFKAKLTSQGVTKTVTFGSKDITAGSSQVSTIVTFEYSWPNYGDVSTGSPRSSTYTVSGYVFKGSDESKKINTTSATVNINLNMDYVLFPQPTGYEGKSGGSGYTFGTWSCGFNEKYGHGTLFGSKCPSNGSMSGQTLNLGSLVDANGNLKGKTKFEWHMRINKIDGTSIPDKKIKEFTVNAGSKPTDDQLKFNVFAALNGYEFIGSVYNSTNNVFYLQITPADDPSVPAIRVWYDGSTKPNNGNRLQMMTPTVRTGNLCDLYLEYFSSYGDLLSKDVAVYLDRLSYNFDGADTVNSYAKVIPTSNAYKPKPRVELTLNGSGWSRTFTYDYSDYEILDGWTYWDGWFMKSSLDRERLANAQRNSTITSYSGTIRLIFTDMLKGSGGRIITDYYQPEACTIKHKLLG